MFATLHSLSASAMVSASGRLAISHYRAKNY